MMGSDASFRAFPGLVKSAVVTLLFCSCVVVAAVCEQQTVGQLPFRHYGQHHKYYVASDMIKSVYVYNK